MLLWPVWEWLEGEVFNLPAVVAGQRPCFNPYQGIAPGVDRPGADRIRRDNLRRYLESFTTWPEALVLGEAPGWRGCRFSGVPFTSEAQLAGSLPFSGEPSSLAKLPHREAAATIFWRVMLDYHPRFLAWNSLPLHPHQPGQPCTNRTPTQAETCQADAGLAKLVGLLQPPRVIAVGNNARLTAQRLGLEAIQVRHPGRGGAQAFASGMRQIFAAPPAPGSIRPGD